MSSKKPSSPITPQRMRAVLTSLHGDLVQMSALAEDARAAIAAARAANLALPEATLRDLAHAAEVSVNRLAKLLRSRKAAVLEQVQTLAAQQASAGPIGASAASHSTPPTETSSCSE